MNNQKNTHNDSQNTNTRSVDREYYAHQETARNKWFNYSDPYYLNNQEVQNYHNNVESNEQTQQNETNQSTSQIRQEKMQQDMQSNETKMGSTTNYAYYAHGNQYPSNGIDPFINTTPSEPITDVESHVNFNTAPTFAGDHLYPSGYTRTEESSNSYSSTQSFSDSYNQEATQHQNQQNEQNSCKNCNNQNKNQNHHNHNHNQGERK